MSQINTMSSRKLKVASWRLSYTTSTLYDSTEDNDDTGDTGDSEYDCDYSVSEVSGCFTFR